MTDQPQTPLQIAVIPVTPFQQNCSILWCTRTKQAVVVDPGGDVSLIRGALKEVGVTPAAIWLTHGHLDHAGGAAELAEALSVPVIGPHEADKFLLDELPTAGLRFDIRDMRAVTPSRWLVEGTRSRSAMSPSRCCMCPVTHRATSPSSRRICASCSPAIRSFAGSVGRTDFPYGSHETLIAGIRNKLLPLGDDVQFLPGHGPAGTLGEERTNNPFLQG